MQQNASVEAWVEVWDVLVRKVTGLLPTGLLPEVLHTDLLSRIITARNMVVFRLSRCSSLPKYIDTFVLSCPIYHASVFLRNIKITGV